MVAKTPTKKLKRRAPRRTPEVIAKQADAVALKVRGETYEAIARLLGYADASGARWAVMAGLAARREEGEEDAEELRQVEAERLDCLQLALWDRATATHTVLDKQGESVDVGPDPDVIATVLKIMDRRAKLLGLDAPVKHAGPEGGDININVQVNVGLELEKLGDDELAHLQAIAGKLALGNDATARD